MSRSRIGEVERDRLILQEVGVIGYILLAINRQLVDAHLIAHAGNIDAYTDVPADGRVHSHFHGGVGIIFPPFIGGHGGRRHPEDFLQRVAHINGVLFRQLFLGAGGEIGQLHFIDDLPGGKVQNQVERMGGIAAPPVHLAGQIPVHQGRLTLTFGGAVGGVGEAFVHIVFRFVVSFQIGGNLVLRQIQCQIGSFTGGGVSSVGGQRRQRQGCRRQKQRRCRRQRL